MQGRKAATPTPIYVNVSFGETGRKVGAIVLAEAGAREEDTNRGLLKHVKRRVRRFIAPSD